MPEQYEDIRYLEPGEIQLFRNDVGHLCMTLADGTRVDDLLVFRTRPISDPGRYISLRVGVTQSEQREIGILRSLAALPAGERQLLREELDRRYFIHIVTRIRALREELGFLYWDCETDKGLRQFVVPRWDQSKVLQAASGCHVITDIDGNRYEIPDLAQLDLDSQARFNRYIYW